MYSSNLIGIIADDLTGANDTALQFHLRGCNTQILLTSEAQTQSLSSTQTVALCTDTRNAPPSIAKSVVEKITTTAMEKLNVEHYYKKIDSTLRGNIAQETLGMLEVLGYDAAVVLPAYPQEGRTTIGGYHLLKGIPIERTDMARDPHSPIFESYIPTILRNQLDDAQDDLVGLIEFSTVIKGAGPILLKLNEFIAQKKKLIVVDSVSSTDIEQVALAIMKSNYSILPCGSSGLAQALGNIWIPEMKYHNISKTVPVLPKLIVSGSSTELTALQLKKLEEDDDFDNTYFISLNSEDILNGLSNELCERVLNNMQKDNIVVVHTSNINLNNDTMQNILLDNELTKKDFAVMIENYLAKLVSETTAKIELILIVIGGETSFKCCREIDSESFQLIDAVAPSIPLCIDHKAQLLITKSGNLGTTNTLIDILRYLNAHEQ